MPDKPNAFDESDAPWVKDEPVRATEGTPVKWLRFWGNVLLPVWAVLVAWSGGVTFLYRTSAGGIVSGVVKLVLAVGLFAVSNGLSRRRLWAWQMNQVLVCVHGIPFLLVGVMLAGVFPGQAGVTWADYAMRCFVSLFSIGLGAVWVGWNYYYFRKRKGLFS